MKIPLPIRVYADFECFNQPQDNPKVLYKQNAIAIGYYIISPFGNKFYSYFGTDGVKWFVDKKMTVEKIANNYFKTNLELQITPQEQVLFQEAKVCWLPFDSDTATPPGRKAHPLRKAPLVRRPPAVLLMLETTTI